MSPHLLRREDISYPNIAPEPSMNLPRVRITPLGPAPYWKMETVPCDMSINKKLGLYVRAKKKRKNAPIMNPMIPPAACIYSQQSQVKATKRPEQKTYSNPSEHPSSLFKASVSTYIVWQYVYMIAKTYSCQRSTDLMRGLRQPAS